MAISEPPYERKDIINIYLKYDGKVENNECKDEEVTAVKLTHILHLILIFSKF